MVNTSAPRRVADWLADLLTVVLYRKVPGVQTPASVARLYFFLFLFLSPVLLLFLAGFFSRCVLRFAMINLMRLEPLRSERALMNIQNHCYKYRNKTWSTPARHEE